MPARLIFETGNEVGREVDLTQSSVVGRAASCDIVLADDSCSRMHARLTPDGSRCRVEDLGSTNGTLVKGSRVTVSYLDDGERVVIGDTTLCFRYQLFDGASTVILPGTTPRNATVTSEAVIDDAIEIEEDEAPRVLDATVKLLEATRGVPDQVSVARALCASVSHLIAADRAAVLLFREGSSDPQAARMVSLPDIRLDPDRPWIVRAINTRRALIIREEHPSGRSLSGLVIPSFVGDEPRVLVYADRLGQPITESDRSGVRHLLRSALALLESAAIHDAIRSELIEHRARHQVEGRLVGESDAHRQVMDQVLHTARKTSPVLFIGETGTGKATFARHLHDSSVRAGRQFVIVNCSSAPVGFLEAEILGSDHGDNGPYGTDHIGCVERANGGTLFLDEIDAVDLASQAKLAAVLREKRIKRANGREIAVDIRLVAASDRDLASRSQSGAFHEDLLALLALGTIHIPPLRERPEDIPLLADHFVKNHARRMNRTARRFSKEAMHAMTHYEWPGNVRELSNVMERAVALCSEEEIPLSLLPFKVEAPVTEEELSLDHVEKLTIIRALAFCEYKKGRAAKVLGISWPTLNKKIHDYQIEMPERGSAPSR